MSSRRRPPPAFIRDTIIAAVLFAVVLAPAVYDLGPEVFHSLGYVLYVPLVVIHVVTGGETEGAHGPSTLLVVAYALALGVVTAGVTHVVRERINPERGATRRFALTAIPAVAGTLVALTGVGALGGFPNVGTTMAIAFLIGGIALVAGGLVLATKTSGE